MVHRANTLGFQIQLAKATTTKLVRKWPHHPSDCTEAVYEHYQILCIVELPIHSKKPYSLSALAGIRRSLSREPYEDQRTTRFDIDPAVLVWQSKVG